MRHRAVVAGIAVSGVAHSEPPAHFRKASSHGVDLLGLAGAVEVWHVYATGVLGGIGMAVQGIVTR